MKNYWIRKHITSTTMRQMPFLYVDFRRLEGDTIREKKEHLTLILMSHFDHAHATIMWIGRAVATILDTGSARLLEEEADTWCSTTGSTRGVVPSIWDFAVMPNLKCNFPRACWMVPDPVFADDQIVVYGSKDTRTIKLVGLEGII